MKIPFSLLPPSALASFSKPFYKSAVFLTSLYPSLSSDLAQGEIDLSEREFGAQVLASASLNGAVMLAGLLAIGFLAKAQLLAFAILGAAAFFTASLMTGLVYPKLLALRRARNIDAQLIAALRQFVIEVKSGVPLYNAMASLTSGDYGEASKEFHKVVRRINGGTSELDALTDVSAQSPSLAFRQVSWQLSNALKVGGDVAQVLESLLAEMTSERMNQIRKYGQELSPWAMMYMMFAVILPSLGLTMLLVVASFANLDVPIAALVGIIVFLIGFQLFFMNFVASRRPAV